MKIINLIKNRFSSIIVIFALIILIFTGYASAADIDIVKIDGDITSNGNNTFTLSNIVIWVVNGTNTDRPITEIRLRCFIDGTLVNGSAAYFTNITPNVLLKKICRIRYAAF